MATNMMRMTWSDSIAVSAQKHANTCPTAHSGVAGFGENLSWGWPTMTSDAAVNAWIDEKAFYTYATKGCQPGQVCAHFTALMWAETSEVGCGRMNCPNLFGHASTDAWVCQYSPAGNYVNEFPYKSGGYVCSECPSGFHCKDNLCTNSSLTSLPAPMTPASVPTASNSLLRPSLPAIQGVAATIPSANAMTAATGPTGNVATSSVPDRIVRAADGNAPAGAGSMSDGQNAVGQRPANTKSDANVAPARNDPFTMPTQSTFTNDSHSNGNLTNVAVNASMVELMMQGQTILGFPIRTNVGGQ
jgi:hypothetical protein